MSAFRSLFGQDIGKSAGIYDSFGKPKQDNLALIAQSRPAEGRMRLGESTQNSAANNMERYRKHPFSSIRLSPVSQMSGVQVQTPFGNHQRDGSSRDESKDLFVENRARNFRQADPFERPISRSGFPLPSVNEGITLDLPTSVNSRQPEQETRNGYQPQRRFEEGEEDAFGKPVRSNRDPFSEPHFPVAKAPIDAFVWSKPITIPQVKISNLTSEEGEDTDGSNTKASLINVNPGDSLILPKTKKLKLPDLPSVSEKLKGTQAESNTTRRLGNQGDENTDNNGVTNLADLLSGDRESSKESLDSTKSVETGENHFDKHPGASSLKLDVTSGAFPSHNGRLSHEERDADVNGDKEVTDSDKSIEFVDGTDIEEKRPNQNNGENKKALPQSTSNRQPSVTDGGRTTQIPIFVDPGFKSNEFEGTDRNVKSSLPSLVASPVDVADPKPNTRGKYDVTILTDEAITKKSGDPPLNGGLESVDSSLHSGSLYHASPLDVPAIKTVVERTIEDGSETIVKNQRHLESDDSGFILTNDLYSDEADMEGIVQTDSLPYTGSASEEIEIELNRQKLQNPQQAGITSSITPFTQDSIQNNIIGSSNASKDNFSPLPGKVGRFHSTHVNEQPDSSGFAEDKLDSTKGTLTGEDESVSTVGLSYGNILPDLSTAERPPVGSGYLLSKDYFENDELEPPPPPPLVPPLTSEDLETHEDFSGNEQSNHATEMGTVVNINKDDILALNEEKIKKMLLGETEPRMGIQTSGQTQSDGREGYGENSLFIDKVGKGSSDSDSNLGRVSNSKTVIEEEHIGLEQLKRMEKEARKPETPPAQFSNSRDKDGLNDFKDYTFDSFGKHEYPFSSETGENVDNSPGIGNKDGNDDHFRDYVNDRERNSMNFRNEDFDMGTNPVSSTADDIGNDHGKFDLRPQRKEINSPTPRKVSTDPKGVDYPETSPSSRGDHLFQAVEPGHRKDSLPEDFIATGFDDIRKPMEALKRDDRKEDTSGSPVTGNGARGKVASG